MSFDCALPSDDQSLDQLSHGHSTDARSVLQPQVEARRVANAVDGGQREHDAQPVGICAVFVRRSA
jgi:hypothetical protein